MLAFISWLISITWKILMIGLLFSLFKSMRSGGKEAIESFVEMVGMTMRTVAAKYKKWLFNKYKEAMDEQTEPPQDGADQGG